MKRVTASQARRHWFEILDEVVAGETILIERGGRRVVLRREDDVVAETPDYADLMRVPDAHAADRWGWTWGGEEDGLEPTDADRESA